ncbi:YheC/YheD family protein [Caldalkalibacillus mannanilyticus]|uniref:YheC/YheD family protein n=1 Tax=Caldalkalibacillus mannanilyticus TaxID=1418 RepID=UPI00046A9432|nr:YheC/YheD family protein [Caldalkalibacillus mannanilyticus]
MMSDPPYIGLFASCLKQRASILKTYFPHFQHSGTLFTFDEQSVNWENKTIKGLTYKHQKIVESTFPFPNAVYNRVYKKNNSILAQLEREIGEKRCFNQITQLNKWNVYTLLMNSNIDSFLPHTYLYRDVDICSLLKENGTLYIKPCYGQQGRRVYKIQLTKEGKINLYGDVKQPKHILSSDVELKRKVEELIPKDKMLIQQEIAIHRVDGQYFDIRALVQKNIDGEWKVTNVVGRIAHKEYMNTSFFQRVVQIDDLFQFLHGLKIEKAEILNLVHEISVKTASILDCQLGHLGELSVDYGLNSEGQLTIIEVNGKPQKKIYRKVKGLKVKKRYL